MTSTPPLMNGITLVMDQIPLPQVVDHNWTQLDQRWRFPLNDPFWRLYLQDDIGGTIITGGVYYPLTPGILHLIPAWLVGTMTCASPVGHHWLHFTPGEPWLNGTHAPAPLGAALSHPWQISDQALAQSFRGLRDLPRSSVRAQTRALAVVLGALDQLAEVMPLPVQHLLAAGPGDDHLTKALRFIESHLGEPLTVAGLANKAGLSQSRFTVAFHERTGHTPMSWLRERRIQAAAYRLRHSNEAIEAIATVTGFANRNHFTRVFTEAMGIAPATYRRQEQDRARTPDQST